MWEILLMMIFLTSSQDVVNLALVRHVPSPLVTSNRIGQHDVPVIFKQDLSNAVLKLRLVGQTLPKGTPHILTNTHHTFKDAKLGLQFPPNQVLLLRNPSDVEAHFHFDEEMLRVFPQDSFGFEVLSCNNPKGVIPPGGVVSVSWSFQPIEAKTYVFPVALHVEDMEESPIMVTFTGSGIDPRDEIPKKELASRSLTSSFNVGENSEAQFEGDDDAGLVSQQRLKRRTSSLHYNPSHRHSNARVQSPRRQQRRRRQTSWQAGSSFSGDAKKRKKAREEGIQDSLEGLPSHQQFLLPKQPAVLSCDVVDFGNLAQYSISRYIFYIRSTSNTSVQFSFDLETLGGVVTIEPPRGIISPQGQQACKLIFIAKEGVGQYDTRIRCVFDDYDGIQKYNTVVESNLALEEEASHVFSYTDKHRIGKGRSGGLRPAYSRGKEESHNLKESTSMVMDATLFPSKALDPGHSPSLSSTLSKVLNTSDKAHGVGSSGRLQPVKGKRNVIATDTDLRTSKYQTLPPIRERGEVRLQTPPKPHDPFVCFVTVRCVVQNEMEVDEESARNLFIDRSMGTLSVRGDVSHHMDELSEDVVAASDILLLMLREAISDTKFRHALDKLQNEPFPVFNSIRAGVEAEENSTHSAALPSELSFAEGILDNAISDLLKEIEEEELQTVQ
eukprot:m.229353 g.229353  ORF g.229353 m.229353 type:complete len:669 (-) comp13883_c0_seq1:3634-5640(-)